MKKLLTCLLSLILCIGIALPAYAITFEKEQVTIESEKVIQVVFAKSFFYGNYISVTAYDEAYDQIWPVMQSWRKTRSKIKSGNPTDFTDSSVILGSAYVSSWLSDGKYFTHKATLAILPLQEWANSLVEFENWNTGKCRLTFSNTSTVIYTCP